MRIAQIAPIVERVPPKKYGGTERVVFELTEELVKRGHEVTLFASGDSVTSARLISVYPRSLREARFKDLYGLNIFTLMNIGKAYDMQNEFDIIHDHNGHFGLPAANIASTPTVMTFHGAFGGESRRIFQILKKPYIVSISTDQTKFASGINHVGTVHNGLTMDNYPFSAEHDNYLLFVGRISVEKGVHLAVRAAMYLDLPLVIAAKLDEVDLPYFKEYIGPYLSERIKWVGEVDTDERNKLMSRAMCFLHPVTWREPFGLTLIEAMACGCPVVAMNRGSIPEIIINGKTGFIVDGSDEMIEAIENIKMIERQDCRKHSLENFNAVKMADGYEAIYRKILSEK